MSLIPRRGLAACSSGAALVEFSLTLPLLLSLAFGVGEFGRLLYQHQLIVTGIRDAARYLARVSDPIAATAAGQNLATTGLVTGGTARVSYWQASDVLVTAPTVANPTDPLTGQPSYRSGGPVTVVRVTTTVQYQDVGFLSFLGLTPPTFTLAHEERFIGG